MGASGVQRFRGAADGGVPSASTGVAARPATYEVASSGVVPIVSSGSTASTAVAATASHRAIHSAVDTYCTEMDAVASAGVVAAWLAPAMLSTAVDSLLLTWTTGWPSASTGVEMLALAACSDSAGVVDDPTSDAKVSVAVVPACSTGVTDSTATVPAAATGEIASAGDPV